MNNRPQLDQISNKAQLSSIYDLRLRI